MAEISIQDLIDDKSISTNDVIETLILMGMPTDEAYFTVKLERGEDPQELTVSAGSNKKEEE